MNHLPFLQRCASDDFTTMHVSRTVIMRIDDVFMMSYPNSRPRQEKIDFYPSKPTFE